MALYFVFDTIKWKLKKAWLKIKSDILAIVFNIQFQNFSHFFKECNGFNYFLFSKGRMIVNDIYINLPVIESYFGYLGIETVITRCMNTIIHETLHSVFREVFGVGPMEKAEERVLKIIMGWTGWF